MKKIMFSFLVLFMSLVFVYSSQTIFNYNYATNEILKYKNNSVVDIKASIMKKHIVINLNYDFNIKSVKNGIIDFENHIYGHTNQAMQIPDIKCHISIDKLGNLKKFSSQSQNAYADNFKNFIVNFPKNGMKIGDSFIRDLVFSFPKTGSTESYGEAASESTVKCRAKMKLDSISNKGSSKMALFNITLVDYSVSNIPGQVKKVNISGNAIFDITKGRFIREKYFGDILVKKGFIKAKVKLQVENFLSK